MAENNKNTLIIFLVAIVFLALGIFLGNSFIKPVAGPIELPKSGGELWFVYNFSGKASSIKSDSILIEGDMLDPDGRPIIRDAVVTASTNIVLRERKIKDDSLLEEEFERREREAFRKVCEKMESANWDSSLVPRTLFTEEQKVYMVPVESPEETEITLGQIMPGDKITVNSKDNIAANTRFEATTVFINRY